MLMQDDAQQKAKDFTLKKRSGVQPVQPEASNLGGLLNMGAAAIGSGGGSDDSGGGGGSANMGAVNRALDARSQADTFQKAQSALQYAPEDLRNTLGPVFADALKRQSQSRRY
jgi:hypothetical protein